MSCPACKDPNGYSGFSGVSCPNQKCKYFDSSARVITGNTPPVAKAASPANASAKKDAPERTSSQPSLYNDDTEWWFNGKCYGKGKTKPPNFQEDIDREWQKVVDAYNAANPGANKSPQTASP